MALLRVLLDAPLRLQVLDEAERIALVVAEDIEQDRGGLLGVDAVVAATRSCSLANVPRSKLLVMRHLRSEVSRSSPPL